VSPAFLPGSDSGSSGSAWQEHLEAPPKARVVPLRDIPSLAIDLLNHGSCPTKLENVEIEAVARPNINATLVRLTWCRHPELETSGRVMKFSKTQHDPG